MTGKTELKPLSVRFHRNGVIVIEDAVGTLHVFEPQETLRDVAKYIWREESLKVLRIEGEESSFKDYKDVRFVKLSDEKGERLRSLSLDSDPYFEE